jgi:predicted metal-dependent phosphoesterase TrpH
VIDLHTHSVFSDGSDTPDQLADAAAEVGLSAIALTDHDTTASAAEMAAACARVGVEHVVGVELSLVDDLFPRTLAGGGLEPRHVHVLAYFFPVDPAHPLQGLLTDLRAERDGRNAKLLARLVDLGFTRLTWADVVARARGEESVGRPHFAEAMFAHHPEIVGEQTPENWRRLFDEWLGDGARAYVPREGRTVGEVADLVRGTGVVLSVAHPHLNYLGGASPAEVASSLPEILTSLRGRGVRGSEAYYGGVGPEMRAALLAAARDAGMIATGGSDYHGIFKDVRLGVGATGDLRVPDDVLVRLREVRD